MLFAAAFLAAPVFAQVGTAASAPAAGEETITLSPFEVSVDKDVGYVATNSLAGSRLNTELFNTPAAISVFTKEFLNDIDALSTYEVLNYTLNGSRAFNEFTGLSTVQQADLVVQARGFAGAALTRDYFPIQFQSDAFNTERIDLSRGPNAILFGIAGSGGAFNTMTKRARPGSQISELQFRVGSWDDYRGTVDVSRSLGRKLAVRVNGVWQDRNSWREFEFMKLKGGALSIVARPWAQTEIRIQGEYTDRRQLVAQPWPSADYSSPWYDAGRPLATTGTQAVAGTQANSTRALVFDAASTLGPIAWFGSRMTTRTSASPTLGGNATTFTRFDLIPRSTYLAGPGATTDNWSTSGTAMLEQRFAGFVVELAANRQESHRDVHFSVEWSDIGAFGDPNATFPVGTLPNGQTAPGSGLANPNAGRYYVESNANWRVVYQDGKSYRATVSRQLDLNRTSRWLGRHQLVALLMREEAASFSDAIREVNVTPPGTTLYPFDLTNAANRIRRRTYLDFGSADPAKRGAQDPWLTPIPSVNGVNVGWRRVQAANSVGETITKSSMLAGQSTLLLDRLNFTWGLRRDSQVSRAGNTAPRDPVTREFLLSTLSDTWGPTYSGSTRTYGAVLHAAPWLAVYYNNANNFAPQSNLDVNNEPVGPRSGRGEDFGLKFRLWEGRIHATLGGYKTAETNRVLGDTRSNNALFPTVNEIWEAMNLIERQVVSNNSDTVTNDGNGWEVELTANPTRQWRLSLNASLARIEQTNTFPRYKAYIEANRALWEKNASLLLISPIGGGVGVTNPTVRDAITHIDATYAGLRQSEGQVPRNHRERSFNLFTTYTLASGPVWLRGLTLGGGANYRSAPVVGYDATRNLAPLYGGAYVIANAMAKRSFKLNAKRTLGFQFNVDNVFNHDDLIVTDRDEKGTYRHLFNLQVRKWSFTTTLNF